MARSIWQASVVDEAGNVVPGATIDVVSEVTGLPVDLYDARTGGANIGNPAFADANGFIQFYTEPTRIRVTATGGAFTITWRNIQLLEPQESSTDAAADRVMLTGAFGLGDNNLPYLGAVDARSFDRIGTYYGAFSNAPSAVSAYLKVESSAASGGRLKQTWRSVEDNITYETTLTNLGVWTGWDALYTEANLNVNVFGGTAASDFLAVGEASSATAAVMFLHLAGVSQPSSITVDSTFFVTDVSGGSNYGTTTTPVIAAASSNKLAYITVGGLSGMTVGDTVYLRATTASSKITVNF